MHPADRLAFAVLAAALIAAPMAFAGPESAPDPGASRRDLEDSPRGGAPSDASFRHGGGPGELFQSLDAQIEVLGRTEAMLIDKYETRGAELRSRVRAAYKLLRGGDAAMWMDPGSHAHVARRRAAARRVLSRDQAELRALRQELDSVSEERARLERDRRQAMAARAPAPASLRLPVVHGRVIESFGSYRHDSSRARLRRRGIALSSKPGRNVRAVADGVVRYAGTVRGLGTAVIVDHGDFWSIVGLLRPGVGLLDPDKATRGRAVTRGELLGEAAGERVYLEIRLEVGAGGFPVDPEPLIDWP
jgi:septal ring factor EnvC (AmiA/AmiB activator)